jgi:hypothetical protein
MRSSCGVTHVLKQFSRRNAASSGIMHVICSACLMGDGAGQDMLEMRSVKTW